MDISTTIKLNDGNHIPALGLGTFRNKAGKTTEEAVRWALDYGYRHIDTAQYYANEASVGKAVRESGIDREKIFVTSKVAISNFGYENTVKSVEESLKAFKMEYIDLFLLHWPVEHLRIESWEALEKLKSTGKVKSIGVSNFTIEHLDDLLKKSETLPVTNQVEFSPFLFQVELLEYCRNQNIALTAYSPLAKSEKLDTPRLVDIAHKYSKSPAQIMIRWALLHGTVVIPKSENMERIKENGNVFDFEISDEDMEFINRLDEGLRYAWNPEDNRHVKGFSNPVVRKLSKITSKITS